MRRKQRLLEDALQLADVARPGVAPQQLQRLRRDPLDVLAQLAAEALEEVLDQERQVVAARAAAAA